VTSTGSLGRARGALAQPGADLTRERFLAYRDRCPDRTCMANAYLDRMREIRDIMEGRWQPAR